MSRHRKLSRLQYFIYAMCCLLIFLCVSVYEDTSVGHISIYIFFLIKWVMVHLMDYVGVPLNWIDKMVNTVS